MHPALSPKIHICIGRSLTKDDIRHKNPAFIAAKAPIAPIPTFLLSFLFFFFKKMC